MNQRNSNERTPESRFERGSRTFEQITGDAGQALLAAISEIAPDLAVYTVEFPFGDLVSRPGLSLKEREIATVSAIVALGTPLPLKLHLNGALNVGCTRQEIVELLMQMTAYVGFPKALTALMTAREVFAERDASGADESVEISRVVPNEEGLPRRRSEGTLLAMRAAV